MSDEYGPDVLAGPDRHRRRLPRVTARRGLLVETTDGFVGAVVACDAQGVTLADRRGRERRFGLHPGAFRVDDRPATLVPPERRTAPSTRPVSTRSGSVAVPDAPTRVARASRLLVEGIHDAELIEQVWGQDLRIEGIVVEVLHGADTLEEDIAAFAPGPDRRLGVLLDHLVPGSKEARLAAGVRDPHVRVTGHPFVDIWAAVRPGVVGIEAWPSVPRDEEWKAGVAHRLGYAGPADLWRVLRARVTTWRDLERELIGAVEQLIDFVAAGDA